MEELYNILLQKNFALITIEDEKTSNNSNQLINFGLLGISWDGNNIATKITGLNKQSNNMFCFLEIKTNKLGFIEKIKTEIESFLEDLSEGLMHTPI